MPEVAACPAAVHIHDCMYDPCCFSKGRVHQQAGHNNFGEPLTQARAAQVYMVEAHVRLNFDNMLEIYKSGYTRIPVYDTQPQAIIGILYTKDLILVDPGAQAEALAPDPKPTIGV